MKKYLYLLKFKDNIHTKIGISSKNNNRILHLNKLYNLNLEESYIITTDKSKAIFSLESELLCIHESYSNEFTDKDGFTEIRKNLNLLEIIDYIKTKPITLGYQVHKYNDIFNISSIYSTETKIKKGNKEYIVRDSIEITKPKRKVKYSEFDKEDRKVLLKWNEEELKIFYKNFENFFNCIKPNIITIEYDIQNIFKIKFKNSSKDYLLSQKLRYNFENENTSFYIGVFYMSGTREGIYEVMFSFEYAHLIDKFDNSIIEKLKS